MHRLDVIRLFTGTNTDLLSGTAFDPLPARGIMRVYIASTVNTARVEIRPSASASPHGAGVEAVPLFANGVPLSNGPYFEFEVKAGEKVGIELSGTTGTVYCWAQLLATRSR